jgi:hypothetical protein
MRISAFPMSVLVVLSVMAAATSAHASFWCRSVAVPGGGSKYICTRGPDPGLPSGPARIFGAIAYSPASGAFGFSDNYGSRSQADNRALSECGKTDCVVASWFYDNCGAVAASDDGSWGGGHGASVSSAIRDAENACARQGGTACVVKVTHCSAG